MDSRGVEGVRWTSEIVEGGFQDLDSIIKGDVCIRVHIYCSPRSGSRGTDSTPSTPSPSPRSGSVHLYSTFL